MEKYAALLRGVNVGGNNKIAMTNLAAFFTGAGCQDVVTYIQSGNVVFSAGAKTAASAPGIICDRIRAELGFQTQIILRSLAQLERIEKANPYAALDNTHVIFLADTPAAERVALLDPNRSVPDEFTVSGSEIYLYLPNGAARTKLTNAYFDSKLKTVSTARNLRTLRKLVELCAQK